MKCPVEFEENAELLLAYCARTLDPAIAAVLDRHISICPKCREFAAAQQAVWNALDEWEAVPVSDDFDRRLYTRIERAGIPLWDRLTGLLRQGVLRHALPVAAAACLAIVAGTLLEYPGPAALPAGTPQARMESNLPDQLERTLDDMELLHQFSMPAPGGEAKGSDSI